MSQSLRKSGQFGPIDSLQEEILELSQSLRKSGQFGRSWKNRQTIKNRKSQSLRKSGQFGLEGKKVIIKDLQCMSQSLRKSGQFGQSFI